MTIPEWEMEKETDDYLLYKMLAGEATFAMKRKFIERGQAKQNEVWHYFLAQANDSGYSGDEAIKRAERLAMDEFTIPPHFTSFTDCAWCGVVAVPVGTPPNVDTCVWCPTKAGDVLAAYKRRPYAN